MSDRGTVWFCSALGYFAVWLVACSGETPTDSTMLTTTPPTRVAANDSLPGASAGGAGAVSMTAASPAPQTSGASAGTISMRPPPSAAVAGSPAAGSGGTPASSMAGRPAVATSPEADGGIPPATMPSAGMASTDAPIIDGACTGPALPPISDYGAMGPFQARVETNTGPGGSYTMFRPTELGANGFLHPPTTWGNGVTTTPDLYTALLTTVASHGFVVIASNSTAVAAQDLQTGLDWLIMQNDMPGDFQGKLAVKCAAAIGYSMGGGAAVGAAAHPNVIATVALHGLQAPASGLHGPLLLITSTNDGFVTKSGFVQPTYDGSSKVPTIMATLNVPGATPDFAGHLIPLGDAGQERAPLIAWLRLYVYGDQAAKPWFYGDACTLCQDPWTDIQRKNGDWN